MMKLNEPYLCQDFTDFLYQFLPDFEKDIRKASFESLSATDNVAYLGRSKKLDLQIFELTHMVSPNARVALATDGFRIMKQSASFRALIVYRSEEADDWRLSLMTLTPEPNEKGKVSIQFSNPKRFSFFLGPNAKINTPYSFLIKKGKVADFEDLKSRFSLEVVNKEFYQEIAELYTKLVGGIRGTGKKKTKHKGIIELPSVAPESQTNHEFAVRLIGRIIFCWFLREKKSNSDLPLMSKEILSLDSAEKTKDFYHSKLEPLFFEILNKPIRLRKEKYSKDFYAQIPYLNGGLFSPQEDDYYSFDEGRQAINHNTVKIPDKWFVELFEVLERYNFTVDENTSVDVDLSIDPEMLGRIFENLLAEINPETGESARKSTGSYYTPRTIVEYMVDESIFQYLKEKTNIGEKKLRALSSYDISDDENYPLTDGEKEKVIEALSDITILDPACGSGAFPIGALQKIVFMLQRVDPDAKLWFQKQITTTPPEVRQLLKREFEHKNFDYIRKLGVIRKSIFGVDIQSIATEISRLRCFLTLVVEETVKDNEPNRGVEPLPNLDFKFVTANSLIGLPKTDTPQQAMFDDYKKIDELKRVRDQYFSASGIEREQLKTEFVMKQKKLVDELIKEHGFMGVAKAELTQKLTDWEPFSHKPASWFDPEWMFGTKNGFNIVIANPPWVVLRHKEIGKELVKYYKGQFAGASGFKLNLFAMFEELSINLLKDGGISTLIVPNRLLDTPSYKGVREKFVNKYRILDIESIPSGGFENVVAGNIVLIIQKSQNDLKSITVRNFYTGDVLKIPLENIVLNPNLTININLNPFAEPVVRKIQAKSNLKLKEIFDIHVGMMVKNKKEKFSDKPIHKHRIVTGKELMRHTISNRKYFDLEDIEIFGGTKRVSKHKESPKLFVRKTGNIILCSIDNNGTFAEQSVYLVLLKNPNFDIKFVDGYLNSRLVTFYFQNELITNPESYPYLQHYDLENIIIPNIDIEKQKPIARLVDKILTSIKSGDYLKSLEKQNQVKEYEKQIDQLVYKLYGLTKKEVEIIEDVTAKGNNKGV